MYEYRNSKEYKILLDVYLKTLYDGPEVSLEDFMKDEQKVSKFEHVLMQVESLNYLLSQGPILVPDEENS